MGPPVRSCGARERLEGKVCGIPHLAKNERDVGHPAVGAGIELINVTDLDRKSGGA
jgi:hypothetical protein